MKVPFAISTSQARNKKGNNEALINMYADSMPPNAKSQVVLLGSPGYIAIDNIGYKIIGLHYFQGSTFIVTPKKLYRLTNSEDIIEVGNVLFTTEKVSIADNGIQMVIVGGNGFYFDGNVVTQITDTAYYKSDAVTFQDGYFIFKRNNSQQFFISKLYSVEFDATMYASAEGSPDQIVGIVSLHQQLFILGEKSIEVWYNSGDALFPFDRIQGSFSKRGCVDKDTIAVTNMSIFWVGDDNVVYTNNGYTPTSISNNYVEYQLGINKDKKLFAFTYTEEGHYFYALTIADTTTMVFDVKTGLWHTRSSNGGQWNIKDIIHVDGKLIGATYDNNVVSVGLDYYTEDGQTIERHAETSPFSNGVNYFTLNKFELDMETGKTPANGGLEYYLISIGGVYGD